MITKKSAKGVDNDHVKQSRTYRAGLDHLQECRAIVIGGRSARFDIGFYKFVTVSGAISFALLALIGDRHVMLGLPRGRNAQVEGCPKGNGGRHAALSAFWTALGLRSMTRR